MLSPIKKMLNSKGLSLVEILLSFALVAGIALSIANSSKFMTKSVASLESKQTVTQALGEIRTQLSRPAECAAALNGRNAENTPSGSLTSLNFTNGKNYSTGTTNFGTSTRKKVVTLSDIRISDEGFGTTPKNGDHIDVQLFNTTQIALTFQLGKAVGLTASKARKEVRKVIDLFVETDDSQNIVKCRAITGADAGHWTRSFENPSHIFYDGPGVGISLAANTVARNSLDVNGMIKLGYSQDCPVQQTGVLGSIYRPLDELPARDYLGSIRHNYFKPANRQIEVCTAQGWKEVMAMDTSIPPNQQYLKQLHICNSPGAKPNHQGDLFTAQRVCDTTMIQNSKCPGFIGDSDVGYAGAGAFGAAALLVLGPFSVATLLVAGGLTGGLAAALQLMGIGNAPKCNCPPGFEPLGLSTWMNSCKKGSKPAQITLPRANCRVYCGLSTQPSNLYVKDYANAN